MNSLYTLGVRQTNSIQADLERLRSGDASASLIGQVSASLAGLSRTVDDYDSMARRELIKVKQEKAQMRVQKFRSDYNELRTEFEKLRSETTKQQRSELLAQPHIAPDARRRYGISSPTVEADASASPFRTPPAPGAGMREAHLLREHTFAQTTSAQLDDFIAQGRGVLDSLVDQRQALKGTRRRLLDAANTLGLSRQVIGWVERRSKQDTYIFFGGAAFTILCFYLILKYLG